MSPAPPGTRVIHAAAFSVNGGGGTQLQEFSIQAKGANGWDVTMSWRVVAFYYALRTADITSYYDNMRGGYLVVDYQDGSGGFSDGPIYLSPLTPRQRVNRTMPEQWEGPIRVVPTWTVADALDEIDVFVELWGVRPGSPAALAVAQAVRTGQPC